MAEYIRREDAIKCIECQCVDGKMWGNDESEGTLIEAYSAIDDLMEIPPADVAPVRHGRWEEKFFTNDRQRVCSLCHFTVRQPSYDKGETALWNYCPNCGAKMMEG